jgi:hypothetical protein
VKRQCPILYDLTSAFRGISLGEPSGVLVSRCWALDIVQRDVVFEYVQQRGHIFGDAGFEDFHDGVVALELRDLGEQMIRSPAPSTR